ncbi:hypothetical protein [Paenibacillus sp. Soil766]|uniref:hypothetical protein n=1 Tax=Paenibacillus sp. Soil766 TaxID=1736404 RepID=UPI001F3BDA35|nr:hypothetical protein [Paenibacillus sp. Soil766]
MQKIVTDNSLVMAIIAINMTIIGLTSLAESKSVIGIDYGRFLIRRYKVFQWIRIYDLLIVFAIVNVASLFLMFTTVAELRAINLVVLILSLIFAIFYFFAYIIVENKGVRKQVLEQELLGLYLDSMEGTTFEADVLVEMSGGSRTKRKLSGNIILYFNRFNSDTQYAFEEIFGPQSMMYDYSDKAIRRRWKLFSIEPYRYRKSSNGIFDISHEFFQMFRYSELQDKWLLDILQLHNECSAAKGKYDVHRLYNVARVLAHINTFGTNESLYKYKFIEYLMPYVKKATAITDEEKAVLSNLDEVKRIESFAFGQLVDYIFTPIERNDHSQDRFAVVSVHLLKQFILRSSHTGLLTPKDMLMLLLDRTISSSQQRMKEVFVVILNEYYANQASDEIPEELKKETIKQKVFAMNRDQSGNVNGLSVQDLFNNEL